MMDFIPIRLTRVTLAFLALIVLLAGNMSSAAPSDPVDNRPIVSRIPAVKPELSTISPEASISHVVVKLQDQAEVELANGRLTSSVSQSLSKAAGLLDQYADGRLRRLFDGSEPVELDRQRGELQERFGHQLADLNAYLRVDISNPAEAQSLINNLNSLDEVEIAYFQPIPEVAEDIDPPTPNYEANQDYLEPAPAGVDAEYANSFGGGDGAGVKIIDIEINWQTTHEDLEPALGAVIGPYPGGSASSDHGTAVLGEMIGGDNGYGVTGICPAADVAMISVAYQSTAQALYTAIDDLSAGDLILIELHAPGPRYNFQARPDQLGYIAMEYWQANYDAILYAWAKGIVVIEAAGNGAEDYDDILYGPLFDTTYRNSHAVMVGAGYSHASGLNLQRLGFSNYGERVNLQGYGEGVYTCGYGSLFDGGGDLDQYYTATFGGTSSASPIVTGAAACLQGYQLATYGEPMSSDRLRDLLVATGTPQTGDWTEHIGPRPDLLAAFSGLSAPPSLYATPIFFDTTVVEGTVVVADLWLHNRSGVETMDFSIEHTDSMAFVGDWLQISPLTGTVVPGDSGLVEVTLDGTAAASQVDRYRGLIEISWGISGGSLDSTILVPAYLTIPCDDTTYNGTKSTEPEGLPYNWISAKDLGSRVSYDDFYFGGSTNKLDDGSAGPFNIGFVFPYYDTSYNRIFVGVNGALSFTDTNLNVNGYFGGIDIPGGPFATMVAPFWSDLIFDTTLTPEAGIYLYNDPEYDTLVVEWYHPGSFNTQDDTTINFEIVLTVDGAIQFQYANVGTSGMEQTNLVGLSAEDCLGLSWVANGDVQDHIMSAGEAVRFAYSDRIWVQSGNVDGIEGVDIADLVYLVTYMFQDGPEPIPYQSGNVNCLGDIDIADLVYLVTFMFQSGPEPCYYLSEL